ncbi:hypothetical protein LCGC14_2288900 [marine sediment metagenome]|uniref:Uncharacterized protein n=1 Tax=marine sediment metagenome TaxID=412755 RepID=A0A0F9FM04_9ZZZZ
MKLLDRYLTAWAALTVAAYVLGYYLAVSQAYDYCMDNWRDAMSYSHDPPPDDWPGLSQCGSESERTFGVWSFVTPSIPPMPAHYEDERP